MIILAGLLLVIGSLIAVVNFYLSFLRPLRFRRCPDEYRHISGVFQIGALMCVGGYLLFPIQSPFRIVAVVAALIDTGSIHWFPIAAVWHLLQGSDSKRGR